MPDPRDVNQTDYPVDGIFSHKAQFLLNYAVLAPSSHNTQPWQFEVSDNSIMLFADTGRAMPVSDSFNRELIISCGAALGNFEIAASFFGLSCRYEYFPDERQENLLANIYFDSGHTVTADDRRLFSAIKDRTTNRSEFRAYSIPSSVSAYLEKEAKKAGIELKLIADEAQRCTFAELITNADRTHFANPEFREELSKWIRANNSGQTDGITSSSTWTPDIVAKIESMIIKKFDVGSSVAAKDRDLIEHSAALVVFATESEEPSQWLRTGKFLSQLLLYFAAIGVAVDYLNQAVEIVDIRKLLRNQAGVSGYPQLVLRIGKADTTKPTARRPLEDVVTAHTVTSQ
ncbi:MAG: hypothetical protein V3U65_04135 [Granulosicoccaceae bacterium]